MNTRSKPIYLVSDYVDMLLIYWRNDCSHEEAARLYAEQYPQRKMHPDAETVALADRTLSTTGNLAIINQNPEVLQQAAERARRNRASKASAESQRSSRSGQKR